MEERLDLDFARILALSPNPYVILDPELAIVWMNDAYLNATMRKREDIIGRKMFDAFPSDPGSESHQLLEASLRRVVETGLPDELALIRYDIAGHDGQADVRYWSATHTPLCDENGVKLILQHTVDVTELKELRQARDGMGLMRRASAVQQQNKSLTQESRRLMDLFEQAPGFTAVLIGPDHRFEIVNEAYRDLVRREDLLGQRVEDALPEIADQGFVQILDTVYATGEAYFGRREQVMLDSGAGRPTAVRFLNFIFQPIIGGDDLVTGIIVQGYDVTDEVEARDRQDLLVNELNHRVKNTLAIVQGLALQSFKSPGSQAERGAFEARLRTLASAHSLLTQGDWRAANVDEIVSRSAQATLGEASARVRLHGAHTPLTPQTAVSLAMLVHELCTNALKYGALSSDDGSVAVAWTESPAPGRALRLEWKESGGPEVREPERTGFGTRLIARGIGDLATGSAKLLFETDGLRCVIETALETE